jgi:hypothetical protein
MKLPIPVPAVSPIKNTDNECGLLRVAMITSAENEGWASDITISGLTKDGLSSDSVIRPVNLRRTRLKKWHYKPERKERAENSTRQNRD